MVIVGPADDDPVTPVGTVHALGGYFLSSPSPKQLGLLITNDDPDTSTIWRVTDSPVAMAPAVRIGGTLSGGAWLDVRGSLLAINRRRGAGPNDAIAVDLDQGAQAGFFSVSEWTDDSVLLSDPRSGLVIVSTDATGRQRLGMTRIGAKEPIHFPDSLNAPGRTYQALAIDPSGARLLLSTPSPTTRSGRCRSPRERPCSARPRPTRRFGSRCPRRAHP